MNIDKRRSSFEKSMRDLNRLDRNLSELLSKANKENVVKTRDGENMVVKKRKKSCKNINSEKKSKSIRKKFKKGLLGKFKLFNMKM